LNFLSKITYFLNNFYKNCQFNEQFCRLILKLNLFEGKNRHKGMWLSAPGGRPR